MALEFGGLQWPVIARGLQEPRTIRNHGLRILILQVLSLSLVLV